MDRKIVNAAKWSFLTEILAKLIVPITNIILAHILAPEAFGIMVSLMMVCSFAQMLSDTGFQKFIVQHEFADLKELHEAESVAFWANLGFQLFIWILICVGKDSLAEVLGLNGMGNSLAAMGAILPLYAFTSIQTGILQRDFNFKKLLKIRMINIIMPLLISVPLALAGMDYWALIFGFWGSQLGTAVFFFCFMPNEIKFYFDFYILKTMARYSSWSVVESISIWLTVWCDTFIVGTFLSSYYLGLYKMPAAVVNTVMGVISSSIVPVLFSALSREQNHFEKFKKIFFSFQKIIGMIVIPMGVGMFVYRQFIVNLIFGEQWSESAIVLGCWALSSAIMLPTANIISEVFRAKGLPIISFWCQILHLLILVPVVYIFAQKSFTSLIYARSIVRVELLIVELFFLYCITKINPIEVLNNIYRYILVAIVMGGFGYLTSSLSNSFLWIIMTIILSAVLYFSLLLLFKSDRILIINCISSLKNKIGRR